MDSIALDDVSELRELPEADSALNWLTPPPSQANAYDKAVGRRLAICRQRVRLDQGRFAILVGVSVAELQALEAGEAPVSRQMVLGLAKTFPVDLAWLFTGQAGLHAANEP